MYIYIYFPFDSNPSLARKNKKEESNSSIDMYHAHFQGYVIYRVRVRRGGRKRPVSKGIIYGKPVHQGITQLKFKRNLRSVAEERVGRRCGGLRVLNSYWINEDTMYKYYEVIMIDPMHKVIRRVRDTTGILDYILHRRAALSINTALFIAVLFSLVLSPGLTNQLAVQATHEAPRDARPHLCGPKAPWTPRIGPNGQQGSPIVQSNMEEEQHALSQTIPLEHKEERDTHKWSVCGVDGWMGIMHVVWRVCCMDLSIGY